MRHLPPQAPTQCIVQCVQKFAKYVVLQVPLLFCLGTASVYADAGDQWTDSCAIGLENTGGRGSNAAAAYCACMSKAAGQFNGNLEALLTVVQAPVEQKTAIYNELNDTNRRIISACAVRVEEAFGVVESKPPAAQEQPKGIWADPQVLDAIRAINFNAAQALVFKASATKYSNDLRAATAKIFREKLDIKRKIKKKQRVLAKRMDGEVMAVLDANQTAAYKTFVKTFSERVKASFGRR